MENFQAVVGSNECPIKTVQLIIGENAVVRENWSQFLRSLEISNDRIIKFRQDMLLDKITYSDMLFEALEHWIGQTGSKATLDALLQLLEGECKAYGAGESLRLQFRLPCKPADDNPFIKWDDLAPSMQQRVTQNFQNLFPNIEFAEALPKLKGAVLTNLMNGKKPPLFEYTFFKKQLHYIKRTLVTRNIISSSIFEDLSPDLYLFTGMDRHELSLLAKDKITTSSGEQLQGHRITVKFIVLEKASHFDKICSKTERQVHLMRKESDGRLRWIRSVGGIRNLQKHIDPSQEGIDEEKFYRNVDSQASASATCISDSPGMGKSTLLSQIGRTLIQMHPNRTVIFTECREFIQLLIYQIGRKHDPKIIASVLNNTFEGVVQFESTEEDSVSVELLLDGFDEMDQRDQDFAHVVLKTIQTSFKFIRLWITSRPHLLEDLEIKLNLLGYNIRAFCEDDQVEFLSSYWSRNPSLNFDMVKEFAYHCLNSLKSRMNSTDSDIAAVPLQCLLIGEVYENDVMDYAGMNTESSSGPLAEVGTITDLYRLLINKKFEKYKSSYCTEAKLCKRKLMKMHACLSLNLLFPHHICYLKQLMVPIELSHIINMGIVESSNPSQIPKFMHRTFAEYFVAWFVVDGLKTKSWWNNLKLWTRIHIFIKWNFFHHVIACHSVSRRQFPHSHHSNSFTFKYPVTCYFINSLLVDLETFPPSLPLHACQFNRAMAHACANAGFVQIFKLFGKLNVISNHGTLIFDMQFLTLAIQCSSLELFKPAFSYFEQYNKVHLDMLMELLREAVRFGKFSIVEFLIKYKQLHKSSELLTKVLKKLIHKCVETSWRDSDAVIKQKSQILRMFLGIHGSLLEEKDSWGRPPLLSDFVHLQLLIELLQLGANALAQDKGGDTVIHIVSGRSHLEPQGYEELVNIIPEKQLKQLVHLKGRFGFTPLMSLVQYLEPTPEILTTFKNFGANFNCFASNGDSLLSIATKWGRSKQTIRTLINLGGKVEGKGE